MDRFSTEYINSTEYSKLEDKLKVIKSVLEDAVTKQEASRKLRYAEVDIEAEREAGRLQPDELYIPIHTIDTNVRREQTSYVQYITQSPRAVIATDLDNPTNDLAMLERDLTEKLRFDGWQLSMFSNIDSFQANGYSIMEVVQDQNNSGEIGFEFVQCGDFGFISDTKDIQAVEMTGRSYYYTKTRLLGLCTSGGFNRDQVDKVIQKEPEAKPIDESADSKDRSLYKILKVMFRVNGVVNVAWCAPQTCDDWIREPRPLFIGRRKLSPPNIVDKIKTIVVPNALPLSEEQYETNYPYIIFPYLISENDTLTQLKGRVFLDQDLQEAVSSLLSSTITKARRSAGLYFSKDTNDPNDDLALQKNIFIRSGCLVNSKINEFQLAAPDPSMFQAIQMLVTANQNETSQVNYAASNRKDSRKTAKEITASEQQQQQLSVVQIVLFAIALAQVYRLMTAVIKSRVLAKLIVVSPQLLQQYSTNFRIKPSGDTDVIERDKLIQSMMGAWPVVQSTPCAQLFLADLLELMFPDRSAKYIQTFAQAQQQQQSQQAQQMQQMIGMAKQFAEGIVRLSKHPEMFSETGRIHAFPIVEEIANKIEQMQQNQPQNPSQPPSNVTNIQKQLNRVKQNQGSVVMQP